MIDLHSSCCPFVTNVRDKNRRYPLLEYGRCDPSLSRAAPVEHFHNSKAIVGEMFEGEYGGWSDAGAISTNGKKDRDVHPKLLIHNRCWCLDIARDNHLQFGTRVNS